MPPEERDSPADFENRETGAVPAGGGVPDAGEEVAPSSPSGPPSSAAAETLSSGTLLAGRFRIRRLLGRGGMGEVYLAEDSRLERDVALKVLTPQLARDPEFRARFLREARAASALNHPNVCIVHEVADDDVPYIAMEFIEGSTLEARLEGDSIPLQDIVSIGYQVADALDAAHAKKLIHRDIKPANVSIGPRGQVKVLDFGLAKRFGELSDGSAPDAMSTQAGVVLGTPSYMSPEQILGRPLDQRSDLFSLGALLYELVTRRAPFPGGTLAEVADKVVHAQPEAMARFHYEVPSELDRIVRKCLQKSVDERYQSAGDLLVDLKSLARELEVAASGASAISPSAETGTVVVSTAAFGAVPATPRRPVEEVKQSDVFLSYANIDDEPMVVGKQGWITQFERNLRVRIEQLSGDPVRIWQQANPLGQVETDQAVIQNLPEAKTLVSILSPPFIKSPACRTQVAAFWDAVMDAGLVETERPSRLFKVVKSPVETRDIPSDVASPLTQIPGFDFFDLDPETGRLREFDEAFGELARQRYHERIYDVAFELSRALKQLQERTGTVGGDAASGTVIFLAMTTSDLAAERDRLRRELTELGHEVVPKQPLPIRAGELEAAVQAYLEECDFAVHLVGDRYGLVPEDTDLSMVALQNRLAAEHSAAQGTQRFIWMPRNLSPRDERQAEFVRELARSPEAHRGAEVISDSLESFKAVLEDACQPREDALDAGSDAASGVQGPPRVYVVCDRQDEQAVERIEDALYEQGIEVSLPGFEASEQEFQEVHIRNLEDADAVLIYYGAGSRSWADFKIRDLTKAAGYRDGRPIDVAAVYVAPPMDRRKERFKSLSVDVLHENDRPPGEVLASFITRVQAAREGR